MTKVSDRRVLQPAVGEAGELESGTWFIHNGELYLKVASDFVVKAETGQRASWNEIWKAEPVLIAIDIIASRTLEASRKQHI